MENITEGPNLEQLARDNWDNITALQDILISVSRRYKEASEELGSAVSTLSQTFINEKEDGYNMTVTEAEHRAKALVGSSVERLRGELLSLELLHKTLLQRVDYLVGKEKTKGF